MRYITLLCFLCALVSQTCGRGDVGVARARLVIWPGLGDPCWSAGLERLIDKIESRYTVSVYCIDQGHGGILGNVQEQVDEVCDALLSSLLGEGSEGGAGVAGYLGFSQGGLFLRVLLQRCGDLPARPLVTLGAPHAGVTSWPSCPVGTASSWPCALMDAVIEDLGMTSLARSHIIPATYLYSKDVSAPLLDTANSCDIHVPSGLHRLKGRVTVFAAFLFELDAVLEPKESAWFGRWDGESIVSFEEQDELGCLDDMMFEMNVVPGAAHMQLDEAFFFGDIMERYFVPVSFVT